MLLGKQTLLWLSVPGKSQRRKWLKLKVCSRDDSKCGFSFHSSASRLREQHLFWSVKRKRWHSNSYQCVIIKTYLLPLTLALCRALIEGSLMRFLMSRSLRIHYDVTAFSEPPHRVIVKDNRQDKYIAPDVLVNVRSYCRSCDFPEMTFCYQWYQAIWESTLINDWRGWLSILTLNCFEFYYTQSLCVYV